MISLLCYSVPSPYPDQTIISNLRRGSVNYPSFSGYETTNTPHGSKQWIISSYIPPNISGFPAPLCGSNVVVSESLFFEIVAFFKQFPVISTFDYFSNGVFPPTAGLLYSDYTSGVLHSRSYVASTYDETFVDRSLDGTLFNSYGHSYYLHLYSSVLFFGSINEYKYPPSSVCGCL